MLLSFLCCHTELQRVRKDVMLQRCIGINILILYYCRSLIGYSRGCQTCGHLMKEHREMSTIELHVQKEVTLASSARCCYVIPFAEIHRSPMFGPYAPIQVPYDERPNGVCQCLVYVFPWINIDSGYLLNVCTNVAGDCHRLG